MSSDREAIRRQRTKAVQLLTRLVAADWFDVKRLADELVVSEPTLAQYMSGELEIPLERQVCLAKFLIDNVPPLQRAGHNLLGQVQAAISFKGGTTELHSEAPHPNLRSF